MNTKLIVIFIVAALLLVACESSSQAVYEEKQQQGEGNLAIIRNQPVVDLGGWSQEREIVRQTYLARNTQVSTYAYTMTYDGRIIEICASIGYPIPYSTQLTNPQQTIYSNGAVVAQAEPNGLYPPVDAEATLVSCVNPDGSITPTYWEQLVFSLPYRIKSDVQIERIGDTDFRIDLTNK